MSFVDATAEQNTLQKNKCAYLEFISVLEPKLRNHSTMTLIRGLTRTYAVVIIVVLALVGSTVFISAWMGSLTISSLAKHPPNENDLVIEEITMSSDNPLILSVKVKSNCTHAHIWMNEALIKDYNQTTVAEYWGEWRYSEGPNGQEQTYVLPICELSDFGSEETLTLNFETSLPSGNYTLWFCCTWMIVYDDGDVCTRATVERCTRPFDHANFTIL